jgi:hypothetical protein
MTEVDIGAIERGPDVPVRVKCVDADVGVDRPGTVRVFGDEAIDGVAGTARFDWNALDAWYEQVFVHPRNP